MLPPTVAARLRPLGAELGKFVVVGGFCFTLDLLLANVFRLSFGLGPTTSKALSTIIATAVSYVGNRLWSFAARTEGQEARHGRDASIYAVINAIGLVITLIPVDVSHYLLDQTSTLAFNVSGVVGTAVATLFRFTAYRRWVFPAAAEEHALV